MWRCVFVRVFWKIGMSLSSCQYCNNLGKVLKFMQKRDKGGEVDFKFGGIWR